MPIKDQVLVLDKFGHSFSIQLLIRKSFLKNQYHFLFFFSGDFCPSENFSCSISCLPTLFPKHFLTLVLAGISFSNYQVFQSLQGGCELGLAISSQMQITLSLPGRMRQFLTGKRHRGNTKVFHFRLLSVIAS